MPTEEWFAYGSVPVAVRFARRTVASEARKRRRHAQSPLSGVRGTTGASAKRVVGGNADVNARAAATNRVDHATRCPFDRTEADEAALTQHDVSGLLAAGALRQVIRASISTLTRDLRRRDDQERRYGWGVLGVGRREVLGSSLALEHAVGEFLSLERQIRRRRW
jgi:hypothetical protein